MRARSGQARRRARRGKAGRATGAQVAPREELPAPAPGAVASTRSTPPRKSRWPSSAAQHRMEPAGANPRSPAHGAARVPTFHLPQAPDALVCRRLIVLAVVVPAAPRPPARTASRAQRRARALGALLLRPGIDVAAAGLPARLAALGYRRVHERPAHPGEYFWGTDVVWVYRRAHRVGGSDVAAGCSGCSLRGGEASASSMPTVRLSRRRGCALARARDARRVARRRPRTARLPVDLDEAAARTVWRSRAGGRRPPLPRTSRSRSARDRPRARGRRLGQAAAGRQHAHPAAGEEPRPDAEADPRSQALRGAAGAALERHWSKREILEAYLDEVYFGHLDGVGIYGFGRAAQVYFSRRAAALDVPRAALLAGMIRSPNGCRRCATPPPRAGVATRCSTDGGASAGCRHGRRPRDPCAARPRAVAAAAPRRCPSCSLGSPTWRAGGALAAGTGRGVVVETTPRPLAQRRAEAAVADGLAELRRRDHWRQPVSASPSSHSMPRAGECSPTSAVPGAQVDPVASTARVRRGGSRARWSSR